MMGFGLIWVILFGVVAIALGLWLMNNFSNSNKLNGYRENNARSILDERFARGEISKEIYEEMKMDLTS